MKLYEINHALENLDFVDKETGEINEDMLNNLQIAFEEKVENIACLIKNMTAEANAIKAEEQILKERRTRLDKQSERLKSYLDSVLQGKEMKFARAEIKYRKSKRAVIEDGFVEWATTNAKHLLKYSDPTADKASIKEAIDKGLFVQFAKIEDRQNLQIK